MNLKWFLIVNPAAGKGSAKNKWEAIKATLSSQEFDFDFAFTAYKSDEVILAQEAIKKGFNRIVSVGGDGTLHNTVNGIMQYKGDISHLKVGVIPLGTGNDWVKTYNIPKHIKRAVQNLKSEHSILQDIGKIEFEEKKEAVYFNNMAGIGFDAHVVNKANSLKSLGFMAYLAGAIISLISYKNSLLKITANNKTFTHNSLMLLIGLCEYSGGGMRLTSKGVVDDGLFDISSVKNVSLFQLLLNIPALFNGKIVQKRFVDCFKASALKISVLSKHKAYIQADGELIGDGGFKVSIMPKAIRFIVPENKKSLS